MSKNQTKTTAATMRPATGRTAAPRQIKKELAQLSASGWNLGESQLQSEQIMKQQRELNRKAPMPKDGTDIGFLDPWEKYADSHRDVFLEEILNFVRTADTDELKSIRQEVRVARKYRLRRTVRRPASHRVEQDKISSLENDEHGYFRDVCMACIDFSHLRGIYVWQIRHFVRGANNDEVAAISAAIAMREKSPDLRKKRGRPSLNHDDKLALKARDVAWHMHIDHWDWEKIAHSIKMPVTKGNEKHEGNEKTVRWNLQRLESYLAARIWEAIPPSYVVQYGEQRGQLRPGVLDHKPLQQMLWIKANLPFREHPAKCKTIVEAIWPGALRAAAEYSDRRVRYLLKKSTHR